MLDDSAFPPWGVGGRITAGPRGDCGRSGNRIFFSSDDILMVQIRNCMIPAIRESHDPMPPHPPFTASHETHIGQPRGQIHFWEWDYRAQTLWGDSVNGVYDPRRRLARRGAAP